MLYIVGTDRTDPMIHEDEIVYATRTQLNWTHHNFKLGLVYLLPQQGAFEEILKIFLLLFAFLQHFHYISPLVKIGCISEKLKYIWFFVQFALSLQSKA